MGKGNKGKGSAAVKDSVPKAPPRKHNKARAQVGPLIGKGFLDELHEKSKRTRVEALQAAAKAGVKVTHKMETWEILEAIRVKGNRGNGAGRG